MASFIKGIINKQKGNPQISQRADKIIQDDIKEQNKRRKSSTSTKSPFDPKFKLKPRNVGDEIGDATRRGFEFRRHTQDGKNKSKKQLIAEIRKAEGRGDTADGITLKEELEKNKIRRASQKKAETTRKSRSIASKLAAGIKAHKKAKTRQQERSMEEIEEFVKNTRVSPEQPGISKIPELTPEMRERFKQEHLESLKEIEKSKQKRKKERKEKEEREEIIRKWKQKEEGKKKRRAKVVSDFKAIKAKKAKEREEVSLKEAKKAKEREEVSLKEARKSHPFVSKSNLADMSPEQMSKIAHRGKIQSPPPGNQTDRMIATAEKARANRKKLKGYKKKTEKGGKKKRGRKTRKKRRRRTKKKRRIRTKKKKRKRRRRTKKRRRK